LLVKYSLFSHNKDIIKKNNKTIKSNRAGSVLHKILEIQLLTELRNVW